MADKKYKNLTILHSNDLYGDFFSEMQNERFTGGVEMLSGYVQRVRKEIPNTIFTISGDMFRGSVIDSEFKGFSTIDIMNAIMPDVVRLPCTAEFIKTIDTTQIGRASCRERV